MLAVLLGGVGVLQGAFHVNERLNRVLNFLPLFGGHLSMLACDPRKPRTVRITNIRNVAFSLRVTLPMRLGSVYLLFACSLFCFGRQAPSSNEKASVAGIVIDSPTKQPLRKAHVTLSPSDSKENSSDTTITDDGGQFSFEELEPGKYTLSTEKLGYLGYRRHGRGIDSTPVLSCSSREDTGVAQVVMNDLQLQVVPEPTPRT